MIPNCILQRSECCLPNAIRNERKFEYHFHLYLTVVGMSHGVSEDIECTDATCHNVRWRNGRHRYDMNTTTTTNILKDTVNVPTGGYVVVRFRSDNVGRWLLHCHVGFDLKDGKQES